MNIFGIELTYDMQYKFLIFLSCVVVLCMVYVSILAKCKKIVKSKSNRYKELCMLNDKYPFWKDVKEKYVYEKVARSKYMFDKFDYEKFFQEKIEEEIEDVSEIIYKINCNQKYFSKYRSDIDSILKIESEVRTGAIPPFLFKSIEERLLKFNQILPTVKTKFVCKISYTSPKKVNHYQGYSEFSLKELINNYDIVIGKMKTKNSTQEERRKLLPSMRYDILKRDGFVCVLCGRSSEADGVKLHVDHILPVSKGGKTDMDNLRTLCEECNLGKSSKYDDLGKN